MEKVNDLRPKLLLVDDRPANILALQAVLGEQRYRLIEATSGPQALTLVNEHPDIALVLLDVEMPEMDGLEVCRRLKLREESQNIPVIFITAIYTEDPFIKKGYKLGAVDYFGKPFDPDILRLKVEIYSAFRQKELFLREKEAQLKASEELLRTGRKLSAILETLTVGVIIADSQGRICQTNEEVLRILKSADQIHTDRYGDFLGWWDHEGKLLKEKNSPLNQALTAGATSHSEIVQVTCLDKSTKAVFISASPLRPLDGGSIVGAVVVLQDVTAHRAIEARLESQIVRLVSAGVDLERERGF